MNNVLAITVCGSNKAKKINNNVIFAHIYLLDIAEVNLISIIIHNIWIPDSGFWFWIPDSGFQNLLGFRIQCFRVALDDACGC